MNYMITTGQIAFFKKFGYLAVEGLLTSEELLQIEKGIVRDFFQKDLWRKNDFLKGIVQSKKILKIASILIGKPLRLLYDQTFFSDQKHEPPFTPKQTLQDRSCISEVSLGILITLNESSTAIIGEKNNRMPLPKGSLLFLNGTSPFPFEELLSEKNQAYYLICYGNRKAMFVCNLADPYSAQLKKWGYSFGDRLKEETHPMVYWN